MATSRLVLAALVVALGACRSREAPAPAASVSVAEVPAPASLLAELSLGNPKQTWARLRLLGGDLAQALPSSLPVLLATSLSLPPSAAGSLDEELPMVGALLSRLDTPEPDAVLGMHVTSGAELVAALTLGDGAKLRRVELGPRLVRLLPAPGAPEFNGALGVSGNYLLLATRVEAMSEAGRFVAETLPRRARNDPGLTLSTTEKILAGPLGKSLREAWRARRAALSASERAARDAKGRAADFADPQVLLGGMDSTVESWLGVLESSREASLSVTPEADRLRAELLLTPKPEGAAAVLSRELVIGSLAPLGAMPAAARAALLLRGEERPSADATSSLGAALGELFGERLKPEQSEKLVAALGSLAKARRGATVLGWVGAPAPALLVICELASSDGFDAAVSDALRLLELGPVSSWLGGTLGKPSLQLLPESGGAHRARLRLQRNAPGPSPLPRELFVTWDAKDGVGHVVVSPDAKLGLAPFAQSERLGAGVFLAPALERLADRSAMGAVVDARLFAPGAPADAQLLMAFGKARAAPAPSPAGERVVITLEAAPATLRTFSRLFALEKAP